MPFRIHRNHAIRFLFALMFGSLVLSCRDNAANAPNTFSEPNTIAITDSIKVTQRSTVALQWSGTLSDGVIGGYFVSIDASSANATWRFTTRQDSTFQLPLTSSFANFTISISACRLDGGNKSYDAELQRGNLNFGSEPFIDLDSNGVRSENEPFTDIGLIDLTPATISLPVRNTAPELTFSLNTDVADTTFPVAQFSLRASDLDGNSTISRVEIALNDPAFTNPVTITGGFESGIVLTVEAVSPRSTVSEANVYRDNSETPLPKRLTNFRLGNTNVLYARCFDVSGAKNAINLPNGDTRDTLITMPRDTVKSKWVARQVTGQPGSSLIVVDDYADINTEPFQSTSASIRTLRDSVFSKLLNGKYTGVNAYQTIEVKPPSRNAPRPAAAYAYSGQTLRRILAYYDVIYWYSDGAASYSLAQDALEPILRSGNKVLFNLSARVTDPESRFLQFSPAQRTTVILGDNVPDVVVEIDPGGAGYPVLRFNGSPHQGVYSTATMELQTNVTPIYRLPASVVADTTQRVVCARKVYLDNAGNPGGRIIMISFGAYSFANLNNNLFQFYEKVFRDEFGQ